MRFHWNAGWHGHCLMDIPGLSAMNDLEVQGILSYRNSFAIRDSKSRRRFRLPFLRHGELSTTYGLEGTPAVEVASPYLGNPTEIVLMG